MQILSKALAHGPPSAHLRVFVVEDMRNMLRLLDDLFEGLGYSVVGSVRTEAEAYQWLKDHRDGYDLAVVDLVLTEGNGLGVIARCKAQGARVVVFTSFGSPAVQSKCRALGADAVFMKDETKDFLAWCGALTRPQEEAVAPK